MIIWLSIFAIIIFVSFILAFSSMRNFREIPEKQIEYSLFLIGNPKALTDETMDFLYKETSKSGLILSIEKLFKGKKEAVVIFGPKYILEKLTKSLELLELEDYVKVDENSITAWEMGVGSPRARKSDIDNLFTPIPELLELEQIWWQVSLLAENKKSSFRAQIRVVVISPDEKRREALGQIVQNIGGEYIIKLPQAYSSLQILSLFNQRSVQHKHKFPLTLDIKEVRHFIPPHQS